jgi:F-type H+-transporting ATPase subunit c
MMRSVYSLRSLNVLAAVVVTLVCADVASAQEDGAAGLAAAGAAVELAYIGIGRLAASAFEGMSRQPEMAGQLQTAMIIAAALIEGFTFYALFLCTPS